MTETRDPTNAEMRLASIAVEMAIMAAERLHGRPIDEVAAWAKRQLTLNGYHNETVGAEWAFLTAVDKERDSR